MTELSFSIPLSGVIRIDDNTGTIEITVNRAVTTISLIPETRRGKRLFAGENRTMFDVVLKTAQDVVRREGANMFSAAELYHEALRKYPDLKRNSFTSHVIACAPNHPSYRHYTAKRKFFTYKREGLYELVNEYLTENGN